MRVTGPPLIIFSGLPGVGKTEIARALARQIEAVYVRIDSIEQALRDSGLLKDSLDDAGYRIGHAIAADNLRLGRIVVADCVNPLNLTRDSWVGIADAVGVLAIEIEVICSDAGEHRRRVETRASDVPGLRAPTWDEVTSREFHPWDRERIVIDTAGGGPQDSVARIREVLARAHS
jgi:predicted kinase